MTMMNFNDHNDERLPLDTQAATRINYIIIFIISVLLLLCGIMLTTRDLFSTAHFFDNMPIQDVGISSNYWFTVVNRSGDIGVTGFGAVASLFIWALQIFAGFKISTSGAWSKNSKTFLDFFYGVIEGKENLFTMNQDKLFYSFLWFAAAVLDTATDIAWYGTGNANNGQKSSIAHAIIISLTLHNFGSEFALVTGGKHAILYAFRVFKRFKPRNQIVAGNARPARAGSSQHKNNVTRDPNNSQRGNNQNNSRNRKNKQKARRQSPNSHQQGNTNPNRPMMTPQDEAELAEIEAMLSGNRQ
jgi:hypothetical protein